MRKGDKNNNDNDNNDNNLQNEFWIDFEKLVHVDEH